MRGSQRQGMSTKKEAARPFGLGTFFVVDGTGREPERAKAGYHYGSGILPFAILNRVWYTRLSSTNKNLEGRIMWNELGISGGTAIIILIALYFVIKWAVKNGIKEAYSAITGKKTDEDIQNEKELKELGLDSEDQ